MLVFTTSLPLPYSIDNAGEPLGVGAVRTPGDMPIGSDQPNGAGARGIDPSEAL
ncbi:MAG: hypothetical protein WB586_22705 [Chthoniobacterales bacterium]